MVSNGSWALKGTQVTVPYFIHSFYFIPFIYAQLHLFISSKQIGSFCLLKKGSYCWPRESPRWKARKTLNSCPPTDTENLHIEQFLPKKNLGLTERLLHNKMQRDHVENGRRQRQGNNGEPPAGPMPCSRRDITELSPCRFACPGAQQNTKTEQEVKGQLDYE